MIDIKVNLCEITTKVLSIGLEGEQNHVRIVFDAASVLADCPEAIPSLAVKAPSGVIYPKVVTKDGTSVYWIVSASDCAQDGAGNYQLTFINDEEVIKTFVGAFRVYNSLTTDGPAPDPIQQWIDEANEAVGTISGAVERAENAATASETAQGKAEDAQTAAETAQWLAETAQEKAEAAQESAETAQGKAEDAQTAAENAQGKAEEAQGKAEDARDRAEAAIAHTPYIDDTTGNWMVWDTEEEQYVNTGVHAQGNEGFSPSASVSKQGDTATISITDKDGTTTAEITDGADGQERDDHGPGGGRCNRRNRRNAGYLHRYGIHAGTRKRCNRQHGHNRSGASCSFSGYPGR